MATQRISPLVDFAMPEGFLPTDGGTIGLPGIDTWTFGPLPYDGFSSLQRTSSVPVKALMQCAHHAAFVALPSDLVVEYYNAKLDHYFITASQPDVDALDSGRLPGWQRIGFSFRAFVTRIGISPGSAELQDVCRIYIPPSKGDSHFFSASLAECMASLANHGDLVMETNAAFLARLPDPNTGACPWYYYDEERNIFHWLPQVFRLWNGRVDSNHRYTLDRDVRSAMIAQGSVPEGYGPEGVAFCGAP